MQYWYHNMMSVLGTSHKKLKKPPHLYLEVLFLVEMFFMVIDNSLQNIFLKKLLCNPFVALL